VKEKKENFIIRVEGRGHGKIDFSLNASEGWYTNFENGHPNLYK